MPRGISILPLFQRLTVVDINLLDMNLNDKSPKSA